MHTNGGIMTPSHWGIDQLKTYAEFTEKLIERFDGKDPKLNFKDLAQLRQTGLVDQFIVEF